MKIKATRFHQQFFLVFGKPKGSIKDLFKKNIWMEGLMAYSNKDFGSYIKI